MALPAPYSSGLGLDRKVSRALARIDADALVASHEHRKRIDLVGNTTEYGMYRAALLGACEESLIRSAPLSADYVHTVAVGGAMGIAAAVYEAARGS
jgi:hypothetical protein